MKHRLGTCENADPLSDELCPKCNKCSELECIREHNHTGFHVSKDDMTNTKPTADLEKYKAMVATFSTKRILEEARGLGMFYREGQIPTPELDAKMEILEEALKPTAEVSVDDVVENFPYHEKQIMPSGAEWILIDKEVLRKTLQTHTTALKGRVVEMVKGNHKGTFTDDAGNDCWYIDELVEAITNIT